MAKYNLGYTPDLYDFILFGITCAENQYVLVSELNNSMDLELALYENMKMQVKNKDYFEFSLFSYVQSDLGLEYFLIPNRSNYKINDKAETGYDLFQNSGQRFEQVAILVPELPQTDYFLILKGENAVHEQYKVFQLLKMVPCISQSHEIIPHKLSSRNNLVF